MSIKLSSLLNITNIVQLKIILNACKNMQNGCLVALISSAPCCECGWRSRCRKPAASANLSKAEIAQMHNANTFSKSKSSDCAANVLCVYSLRVYNDIDEKDFRCSPFGVVSLDANGGGQCAGIGAGRSQG